jgi:YVTN family beta-propeller protein
MKRAMVPRLFVLALLPFLALSQSLAALSQFVSYVCDTADNTVSVVDITTPPPASTPAPTISVGLGPLDIAITPDGSQACVANSTSNTASIIDLNTEDAVSVPVGNDPRAVAITPDGSKACVANIGNGTVSIIDLTSLSTTSVDVGLFPRFTAITLDSSQAYVCNFGSSSVSIIDLSTSSVTHTVSVGSRPFQVAMTPDGSKACVTCFDTGLEIIDIGTHLVTTIPITDGVSSIAITPDGTRACIVGGPTGFCIVHLATATIDYLPVGNNTTVVAVTPDGAMACVATAFPGSLAIIDLSTLTIFPISIGQQNLNIAITPDSTKVCVTDALGTDLFIVNLATREYTSVPIGKSPSGIAIRAVALPSTNPDKPSKFIGTIRKHKSGKSVLHTKWRRSLSHDVVQYEIFAYNTKIASIASSSKRSYAKKLHSPFLYCHRLPQKFLHRLHKKYKIRAVNTDGMASPFTHLKFSS